MGKPDVPKVPAKFPRFSLAVRRQWNVGASGVLAGECPLGFAVADEVNIRGGGNIFFHGRSTCINIFPGFRVQSLWPDGGDDVPPR